MPAKVKVTVELLEDLITKAKRVKKFQAGRFVKGSRSDGQPIYHYPKITLTVLAAKLSISANYLTILKNKDEAVEKVLRHVGQPRRQFDEVVDEEPRDGTKAYKDLQIKRLREKVEKLEKNAQQNRERNLTLKEAEATVGKLISTSEDLIKRNNEQKRKVVEQEAVIVGLRVENASLRAQLSLQKE
jgi:hypothetical protein